MIDDKDIATVDKRMMELILIAAEQQAPNANFVQGCRKFFTQRGYLSEKQLDTLQNLKEGSGLPNSTWRESLRRAVDQRVTRVDWGRWRETE